MSEKNIDMKLTQDYLDKTLEIVFSQVDLSINTTTTPISFKGQGTITLNDDYSLKLNMIHIFSDDERERFFRNKTTAGNLIKSNQMFNLIGTDIDGETEWQSNEIWYTPSINFPSSGTKIETEIDIVSSRKNAFKPLSHFNVECSFLSKSMKLPKSFINYEDGSTFSNTCKLDIGNISVVTTLYSDHITLVIEGPCEDYSEDKIKCIIEGIGIALGKTLVPMVKKVITRDFEEITFYNATKYLTNELPSPLFIYRLNTASFSDFIRQYVNHIPDPNSNLFMNWFKVIDSEKNIIDNKALIQGVVIENMVKTYFSDYGSPTIQEINNIKDSIKHLEKCKKIVKNIKDRIISAISNWTGQNNRSAIIQLKDEGKISIEMYNAWDKTRQPLAHGAILTAGDDDNKIQIVYSDTMATLSLFYYLIFLVIKYKGKFINYSKMSYPEEEIS